MKLETLNKKFRANGKLLIAGEYAVLDGGLAFAIPTKFGQTLEVEYLKSINKPKLKWEAYLQNHSLWFSAEFDLKTLEIVQSSNAKLASELWKIFSAIEKLNPDFFQNQTQNIQCKTQLEFPKDWGLGSSSTLIYLLANWTSVDPFELNRLTFNTSGYDVACASMNSPLFYQNLGIEKRIEPIEFHPSFADQLYFIHLNQKQDTQINVSKNYRELPKDLDWVNSVSTVSYNMAKAESLAEFETLMSLHEELISSKLNLPKVKDLYFSDYEGSVKSLGAWGGDFVLVTAREEFLNYFTTKGYSTILHFKDLKSC